MKKQNLYYGKLLSIILSFALTCTALAVSFSVSAEVVGAATEPAIWDGKTISESLSLKDEEAANSSANPYLIESAADLAYLCKTATYDTTSLGSKAKYYQLTTDIYLNNINVESGNWYDEVNSPNEWVDTNTSVFSGVLDGNGHIIYGLYINKEYGDSASGAGLFGLLTGCLDTVEIKNLGISNSYIRNPDEKGMAGAFAARQHSWEASKSNGIKFSNCFVDETVQVIAHNAGGFIGLSPLSTTYSLSLTISNCFSGAKIESIDTTPGRQFIATSWTEGPKNTITIENSYTTGNSAFAPAGAVISNSYTTYASSSESGVTVLNKSEMTGAVAKRTMNLLDFTSVWYTEKGKTPQLQAFCDDVTIKSDKSLWDVWDGTFADGYAGGTGKSDDPYLISNAEQLAYLCKTATYDTTVPNNKQNYYKLTDDIYLNDVSVASDWYASTHNPHQWTYGTVATCNFGGVLDGDGHVIYGLYINGEYDVAGLFGKVDNCAVIKNLGISKSNIWNDKWFSYVGAFAGQRNGWQSGTNGVVFSNCFVDDTVTVAGHYAGGFIGLNVGGKLTKIENSFSAAKMKARYPDHDTYPFATYQFIGKDNNGSASAIQIENSYSLGDKEPVLTGNATYTDCYAAVGTQTEGLTVLTESEMVGEAMSALNFTTVWRASDASIPQLKVFAVSGDVNSDENVNILDLVRLKKYLVDSKFVVKYSSADMEHNRCIDSSDLVSLRKVLLGTGSNF